MQILMVCLGNICRSPMAEGIMRQKINEYGLNAEVDSCGTAAYHIGQSPDKRAIQTLRKYNIDISKHRGRQFDRTDFDKFDAIFVMDTENFKDIIKNTRNQGDREKVKLLLDVLYPGMQKIVPDPYYGDLAGFDDTYRLINQACDKIARQLV
ncbi:MAG: low molecular weight phosphotyrosine protein phosphatase [Bacteroidales bacterium]|nr:low molecular weight phosphotyrosine protein phosphatase [Bacteroidales bacterium]